MANSKDVTKALIREQYYLLGVIVKKAAALKDTYRAELEKISKMTEFTVEYQEDRRKEAGQNLAEGLQALYEDVEKQAEKLQAALLDMHGQADLANPALTNALKIIELAGPELGGESIQMINAEFSGNQPSLRLLKAAYQAAGVVYDGGLDKMIYNLEDVGKVIIGQAKNSLLASGSLNTLAGVVGKYAAYEGLEFEKSPDPIGANEFIRRAAGLS